MPYANRPFGPLKNSYGPRMNHPRREYLTGRFRRVTREMTEIINHAYGLFHGFLVLAGDTVCDIAEQPLANIATVRAGLLQEGLDDWTQYNGLFAMRDEFFNLLVLGYSVTES